MDQHVQIFIDQQKSDKSSFNQQIKYIKNAQSDEFISQFLINQNQNSFDEQRHQSAPQITSYKTNKTSLLSDKFRNSDKKNKRQKSLFHNFQKHLVITLKKVVKIKPKPEQGLIGKIGQQMWNVFIKSHLYTKTILNILYGAEQQQEQECSFTSAMLNRFGFVNLFNKYSQDLVKQAQCYLRKQTVTSLKNINIKQNLSKRKLSKQSEFQQYLLQFIEQLTQGPMKKRIPKEKKTNLNVYKKSKEKSE